MAKDDVVEAAERLQAAYKAWERYKPGVYDFAGFGMGHYHSIDGTRMWITASEAQVQAKKEGVQYLYMDTLQMGYDAKPFTN